MKLLQRTHLWVTSPELQAELPSVNFPKMLTVINREDTEEAHSVVALFYMGLQLSTQTAAVTAVYMGWFWSSLLIFIFLSVVGKWPHSMQLCERFHGQNVNTQTTVIASLVVGGRRVGEGLAHPCCSSTHSTRSGCWQMLLFRGSLCSTQFSALLSKYHRI